MPTMMQEPSIPDLIERLRKRQLGGDEQSVIDAILRVLGKRPELRQALSARDVSWLEARAGGAVRYAAAWDESKHPRGQPENKGEFGPGGGKEGSGHEQVAGQNGGMRKPTPMTAQIKQRTVAVHPDFERINPVDRSKVDALVASMRKRGWKGDPLLVCGRQLLTGTHRMVAANEAGIQILVVKVDLSAAEEAAKKLKLVNEDGNIFVDDHDGWLRILQAMDDKPAAELFSREMKKNQPPDEPPSLQSAEQRTKPDASHYARSWNALKAQGQNVPASDLHAAAAALSGTGQAVAWDYVAGSWLATDAEVLRYGRQEFTGGVCIGGRVVARYAKGFRQGGLFDAEDHPRETASHGDKRAGEFAPKAQGGGEKKEEKPSTAVDKPAAASTIVDMNATQSKLSELSAKVESHGGYTAQINVGDDGKGEVVISAGGKTQKMQLVRPSMTLAPAAKDAIKRAGKSPDGYGMIGAQILRPEVVAKVNEIMNKVDAHKAEQQERNLPGMKELERAIAAQDKYEHDFERMMGDESNDGARPPAAPTLDVDALKAKYPRAATYVEASKQAVSSHWSDPLGKVAAAHQAKEILDAGGDLAEAKQAINSWQEKERSSD